MITYRPRAAACCMLLTLFALQCAFGSDDVPKQDIAASILRATDELTHTDAISRVYLHAGSHLLNQLARHRDSGIALTGAWARVVAAARTAQSGKQEGTPQRSAFQADLERFLGFVEGRLRITPPADWVRLVRMTEATADWGIQFGEFYRFRKESLRLDGVVFRNGSVRRDGDDLQVTLGSEQYRLRDALLKSKRPYGVVGAISGDLAVTALITSHGLSYPLMALDKRSGEVKWSADVWALGDGGGSGLGDHWSNLVIENKNVYVFGIATNGLYIEAFSLQDGTVAFRFRAPLVGMPE